MKDHVQEMGKSQTAHWTGYNGDQMERGIHVCSTNPSRERNWEAGGYGKTGERKSGRKVGEMEGVRRMTPNVLKQII